MDEIPLTEHEGENKDEEMGEIVVQEGWVVQNAQYPDNARQGVQTTGPSALVPTPRMRNKQQVEGVEVIIHRGKCFPSGLISASGESHNDPFPCHSHL